MREFAAWFLTLTLMLGGLVGVVLPLVPGTLLILIGAIVHKLILPDSISWAVVGYMAGLWGLSMILDFAGVMIGTRWFGGGKWGMAGAGGGAFVGLFFSLPALVLSTILGAVAAEKLLGRKSSRDAIKAGLGAASGFVISGIARLTCAFSMIGLFLLAALHA
ncbi:MAG TPA: DUF456 domain-containing protein [Opitutaceae bacterium]|nr:DUF456 domain-containing protein [Opitutaceae bacterium]